MTFSRYLDFFAIIVYFILIDLQYVTQKFFKTLCVISSVLTCIFLFQQLMNNIIYTSSLYFVQFIIHLYLLHCTITFTKNSLGFITNIWNHRNGLWIDFKWNSSLSRIHLLISNEKLSNMLFCFLNLDYFKLFLFRLISLINISHLERVTDY